MSTKVIYDSKCYKETEAIIARIETIHENEGLDVHIKFDGWNFGDVDLLQDKFPNHRVYYEHAIGWIPHPPILHVRSSC